MIFSEESRRVTYEMGNMELFELGQISSTVQCHSCLKHMPEGLKSCECGVCLWPDEDTINRMKASFQALIAPYELARVNRSRGERHGDQPWQEDQRNRYENTITMKSSDPNLQSGPMCPREDCRATTKVLLRLREEQGGSDTYVPKDKRSRQIIITLDPELQQRLEWLSLIGRNASPTSSSSSSWSQSWWEDTQWQDARWENHQWHGHSWKDHQ